MFLRLDTLLNFAIKEHHDFVRHGHGFYLIMRTIEHGGFQFLVKFGNI